jgi:hypothetical protein
MRFNNAKKKMSSSSTGTITPILVTIFPVGCGGQDNENGFDRDSGKMAKELLGFGTENINLQQMQCIIRIIRTTKNTYTRK